MKSLSRVVWSEGMYLGPHHFQAQSRYFEDSIQFAMSALWFETYGVVACELDSEALGNGTVSLIHARGIFPDGLIFHIPESDPLPAPRPIGDFFPPTRDRLTVYLAVPPRKQDGLNCTFPEETPEKGAEKGKAESQLNGARYFAETRTLHDETTGRDERPVKLGRKNVRLLFDTELAGDMVLLPIARVTRSSTGQFVFDPLFIAPCLQISSSERLMTMLRRLLEILEEKSATLSGGRGGNRDAQAAFSTREIAAFWMLHTVNSGLAPLRHLFFSKRGHPEELFLEMSRLGGALCTFALESHPRTLPAYEHAKLDECFGALDLHIRTHLETIIPTNCISIPLKKAADYLYEGTITDQRCFGRANWILAIRAGLGDADLITTTPRLVKFCSRAFVLELVKRALPGMPLTHLPVPPPAVSARVETQYFGVTKATACWEHIQQTRQVGVYVPGELPDPVIELLVVLET